MVPPPPPLQPATSVGRDAAAEPLAELQRKAVAPFGQNRRPV